MKIKPLSMAVLLAMGITGSSGCVRTHSDVVISQPKPLQVDVNLNGKLTLVIQNARRDMEYIAGGQGTTPPAGTAPAAAPLKGKPSKTPAGVSGAAGTPTTAPAGPNSLRTSAGSAPIIYADDIPPNQMTTKQQVLAELREDFPRLRALLVKHLIGEAHTGYVVARGRLSGKQKKLIKEDNAYRRRLYEIVHKSTGQSLAKIGLIYFQVRLRFVPNGAWVQQLDSKTGVWKWVKWVR